MIDSKSARKMARLDNAFAWTRPISNIRAQLFVADLQRQFQCHDLSSRLSAPLGSALTSLEASVSPPSAHSTQALTDSENESGSDSDRTGSMSLPEATSRSPTSSTVSLSIMWLLKLKTTLAASACTRLARRIRSRISWTSTFCCARWRCDLSRRFATPCLTTWQSKLQMLRPTLVVSTYSLGTSWLSVLTAATPHAPWRPSPSPCLNSRSTGLAMRTTLASSRPSSCSSSRPTSALSACLSSAGDSVVLPGHCRPMA
mmetsp:Transcript_15448/g.42490  ORF Transcript_15448/g.42490 Transcript_15448/m.42490 type:complete len:258 (+) Transcript_15448:203-976(+)